MAEKFWFDRAKDGSVSRGGSVAGSEFPSSQVSAATTFKSANTQAEGLL
jgi:hypothetical protein